MQKQTFIFDLFNITFYINSIWDENNWNGKLSAKRKLNAKRTFSAIGRKLQQEDNAIFFLKLHCIDTGSSQ